jgi:hypothetical protein
MSFLAWREWIDRGRTTYPVLFPTLSVPPEKRDELLAQCEELLYQDEFRFWLFSSDEIEGLQIAYASQVNQPGAVTRDELRPLLIQAVRDIVTGEWRDVLCDRLRRTAPLLRELYKEDVVWQWAVVAADTLKHGEPQDIAEHPFLLGMMAYSLDNVLGMSCGWFDG